MHPFEFKFGATCRLALSAAVLVFCVAFAHRCVFVPLGEPPVLLDADEMEMHQASLGQALGVVPQRLIWPGGLIRHGTLLHLGCSWLADSTAPKNADGFALHIGKVLLEPQHAWFWLRLLSALVSSLGFGTAAFMAVRQGAPMLWATAIAIAAAAFPLHLSHGAMVTPDALAWGLALLALALGWDSARSLWMCFSSACLIGLAVGSKLTVLPLLPALALLAITRGAFLWRSIAAWIPGLLLGMLLANPFFLADPLRFLKTMTGVLKFKPGEFTGIMRTIELMAAGIPIWIIILGIGGLMVGWRKGLRAPVIGVLISWAWMFQSSVTSKQVMPRYFPPLGCLLLFFGVMLVLPWLAARLDGFKRKAVSCALAVFALSCTAIGHAAVSQLVQDARTLHHPVTAARQCLDTLPARRIAVDSSLFQPETWALASPASLDSLAEALETERIGHRSAASLLRGFAVNPSTVRVLGGLFEESETNHAARLRAMAMATKGSRDLVWFFNGSTANYGRLWQHDLPSVTSLLANGAIDAILLRGEVPAALQVHEVTCLNEQGGKLFLIKRR